MNRDNSSPGSNNRGMVDDMLGGISLDMLLDSDLGNMLDLMVNLNIVT